MNDADLLGKMISWYTCQNGTDHRL